MRTETQTTLLCHSITQRPQMSSQAVPFPWQRRLTQPRHPLMLDLPIITIQQHQLHPYPKPWLPRFSAAHTVLILQLQLNPFLSAQGLRMGRLSRQFLLPRVWMHPCPSACLLQHLLWACLLPELPIALSLTATCPSSKVLFQAWEQVLLAALPSD